MAKLAVPRPLAGTRIPPTGISRAPARAANASTPPSGDLERPSGSGRYRVPAPVSRRVFPGQRVSGASDKLLEHMFDDGGPPDQEVTERTAAR